MTSKEEKESEPEGICRLTDQQNTTGQKRSLQHRTEDKRDETKIHYRHRLFGHHHAE